MRGKLDYEFLMQVSADLDDPQILSDPPSGTRRIPHGRRGAFCGPGLQGELLPGGGDWVLLRQEGGAELDIRFTLQTDDKQLIYMHCLGIFNQPDSGVGCASDSRGLSLGRDSRGQIWPFKSAALGQIS
jgi:uncharacterized protein DUF3237